jgi:outer membrane protein assembly factor BamA
VNVYDRKAFKYNKLAPLIFASFNPDDGLIAGAGMLYQTEGFRVTPYRQRHTAVFTSAFGTASYNFIYGGEFIDVIGHWGLDVNADIKAPGYVNNFFGLGNETDFDKDIDEKPGYNVEDAIDYYRYRFDELKLEIYITRRIGEWGVFKAGPVIQTIGVQDDSGQDRFVNEFALGLPYNLFDDHTYAGACWKFTIDKRDNARLTTRGVVFNVRGKNFAHLAAGVGDFSSYESSVSFYHSFRLPARVVFAARVGGGINTGDFQFFQAQILNGLTELRGFRKSRFYGDRKFYSNIEMRLKLFSLRTYLFPASLGILAFHDLGRVWYKDENNIDPTSSSGKSDRWHRGWGGGLWFTPFNLTILSIEAGHSPEGTLGYVRLGFLF